MRLKIDEILHDDVAAFLAAAGHDVHTVHDEGMRGAVDRDIAQRCCDEDRALITLDLDFADIRAYPPKNFAGLLVLRVGNQSLPHILNVMASVLKLLEREPLSGRLWIVTESGVRIRD